MKNPDELFKQWLEHFQAAHEDWRYADSEALMRNAFKAGRASLPAEQDADNSKLLLHAAELLQAQVSYVSMGFDHPPEIASSVDYDCEQTAIALRELAIANRKDGV
jgi:hypothetical protein